ncbi:MAG: Mur ligase family protein, partial [Candidatus Eremiobacteraeota bacterium]|nr:Mur ligase family protein [Candidatus Eremiobacteraeota bacterium]
MTADAWGTGASILVIGLGRTGLACVEVLRARGARVFAVDEKPARDLSSQLSAVERFGASFVEPSGLADVLPAMDAAVLSPGVPLDGELARRVHLAGVPLLSEIELAYRLSAAPVVAVTGTKGKSTTTALIGHLFSAAGTKAFVGGNIGNALVHEALKAAPKDWVVAEVSSFQLEAIQEFKPRIAVILNLSPDHLDRYASM